MTLVPVHVRFGVKQNGRKAPMMVWAEEAEHRPGTCEPVPEVLEQLTEFEAGGRFLGEWDGRRWWVGKRLADEKSA